MTRENTRQQQLRAVPDRADQRAILDALFAKGRPATHHGSTPSQEWGEVRTAWLNRVRAWQAEQGKPLSGAWVPEDVQAAYVADTGDRWVAPDQKEKRPGPALQPCGTEAAYQRHKAHGEPVDEACQRAANAARVESRNRVAARTKAQAS